MKKIILIILGLMAVMSCNTLEVEPQNSIPAEGAFQTKEDIERGILGAYASFQSLSYYGRTYLLFSDLAADNLAHPVDATAVEYAEVDSNSILPENGSIAGIWFSGYDGINVANNVIVKVPTIPEMTLEEQNVALAELYFIRALNHFNLMNYFGAIPLKLTPTIGVSGLDMPRSPVNEVFDQIIEDLTFASVYLPPSGDKTRSTKYAAKALLARVYLYKNDYVQAVAMASEVIEEGGYTLLENYADIFADDESSESIFEIYFSEIERNRIAEYNFPHSLNGRREVQPSESLLEAYETNDERFEVSIAFEGTDAYAIKYDDLSLGADNVIVLRLAEMYLIRAEAMVMLNGNIDDIKSDINTIRFRASLLGTSAQTYPQLLLAIERERQTELAFEGQRWFDLVRTERAIDVLSNVNNSTQTLFPIPTGELQTNNHPGMVQNPGY
ncbi:MAG TPA: RagB/SusD family nutrient uptake outer membrane protein [Aquaticitalea sp.]|nr:RagB/SusD family nutrient uptake outer membrane protein [Aquaticitalea sp.]